MRYGQSRIELTDEERREAKAVLRDNLVSLRKNLFLSQTEFGNRTGISRIRLSMIECGKYEMTWSQLLPFFSSSLQTEAQIISF